ncbi:hypothetical protein KC318_g20871, partial [Hortaea werneckii]
MAAIDPSAEAEGEEGALQRATLKVIRQPLGDDYDDEEDDDEFDADEFERRLAEEDDEDDSEDDEETNGGPSDPKKSKKARKEAAEAEIRKMLMEEGMDVDEDDSKPNGVAKSAKAKGKMPASDEEDDEDDEDDDDMSDEGEVEEFVICTLDPQKNYQQPLDITVGDDERVWFKVSGTHSIFLTGNYVELPGSRDGEDDDEDDYDSEDDYDLEPDEDEIDEEDELDDMGGPRITEVEDEEEAPKLVEASKQADKKNNKRAAAEDEPETLDEMITKESGPNGEQKLSKKQLKKQKKNDGSAVTVEKTEEKPADAPSSAKSDKKVSFAKELEQGPTPNKDEKAKG